MKTAISLPDGLFKRADRLAKRLGKTRSKLYQDAVVEYVARHSPEAMTRAIDEVLEKVPNPPDEFVKRAGLVGLRRIEWED